MSTFGPLNSVLVVCCQMHKSKQPPRLQITWPQERHEDEDETAINLRRHRRRHRSGCLLMGRGQLINQPEASFETREKEKKREKASL